MNTEFPIGQWNVTPATKVWNEGEVTSYGSVDSGSIIGDSVGVTPTIGYMQYCYPCCNCYHTYPIKSAREQVIDEILTKMADAVSKDDFKKAKQLAQLAKQVKEL